MAMANSGYQPFGWVWNPTTFQYVWRAGQKLNPEDMQPIAPLSEAEQKAREDAKYAQQQADAADMFEANAAQSRVTSPGATMAGQQADPEDFKRQQKAQARSFRQQQAGKYPRLAGGTTNWPGGAALVGDRGMELVNLPAGARVLSSPQLMNLLTRLPVKPTGGGVPGPVQRDPGYQDTVASSPPPPMPNPSYYVGDVATPGGTRSSYQPPKPPYTPAPYDPTPPPVGGDPSGGAPGGPGMPPKGPEGPMGTKLPASEAEYWAWKAGFDQINRQADRDAAAQEFDATRQDNYLKTILGTYMRFGTVPQAYRDPLTQGGMRQPGVNAAISVSRDTTRGDTRFAKGTNGIDPTTGLSGIASLVAQSVTGTPGYDPAADAAYQSLEDYVARTSPNWSMLSRGEDAGGNMSTLDRAYLEARRRRAAMGAVPREPGSAAAPATAGGAAPGPYAVEAPTGAFTPVGG